MVKLFFGPDHFSHRFGEDYFTAEIEECNLVETDCCFLPCQATTPEFGLKVQCGRECWKVHRQRRDFEALRARLHSAGATAIPLPPDVPLFTSMHSAETVEESRRNMASFTEALLKLFNEHQDARGPIRAFLCEDACLSESDGHPGRSPMAILDVDVAEGARLRSSASQGEGKLNRM